MAESPISPSQTIGGEVKTQGIFPVFWSSYEVTKLFFEAIGIVIALIKMLFEIADKFSKKKIAAQPKN